MYITAFALSVGYCFLGIVKSGKRYQAGFDPVLVLTLVLLLTGIVIQQFVNSDLRICYLCIIVCTQLLYSRWYKLVMQTDGVTELLNRLCYENKLGNLNSDSVILFFDINKFKQVNDTYGHNVGDICLKKVAEAIKRVYHPQGECYRVGGDEFCVILHHTENLGKL